MLSYGSAALVKSVTNDLLHDFLDVYDPADAYAMMAIATLKVIKPSITANRMSTHYNRTFVCKHYPGAAMSKNSIKAELSERPDLHFLTPIKRNDVRITDNQMLSFEGVLEGVDGNILYKKNQIKVGRFLYAFKDAGKAAKEEHAYLANAEKKGTFSPEKYAEKKNRFGVIVLESDQNMEPRTAYIYYDDRWMLELVFNRYKSDECLDHTDVQGDFSVIGSEFVELDPKFLSHRTHGSLPISS